MISPVDHLEKQLRQKLAVYIESDEIQIQDDSPHSANPYFIYEDFPWGIEYIDWKKVPNSQHCQVRIPYKPEECRDFVEKMIKEYKLKGPVVVYGNLLLSEDYRMDISLLSTVVWDFMAIPICLYAVNPKEKWCFAFKSYNDLNFGYAPEI